MSKGGLRQPWRAGLRVAGPRLNVLRWPLRSSFGRAIHPEACERARSGVARSEGLQRRRGTPATGCRERPLMRGVRRGRPVWLCLVGTRFG